MPRSCTVWLSSCRSSLVHPLHHDLGPLSCAAHSQRCPSLQIAPRDQRRLFFRVCAVLIAMRAVSIFTVDLNATEVAAAHGLAAENGMLPVLARLTAGWMDICGHIAGMLRLPSISADLAVLLLVLAYCRLNGWGTLSGLLSGFMLAMQPFGLDEGWRADGTPLLSLGVISALLLARRGLKEGRIGPAIGSAVVIAITALITPLVGLLLPAGIYAALRSVTGNKQKYVVIGGWVAALVAGVGARIALGQPLSPQATLAESWLANPSLNAAGGALPDTALGGLFAAFEALSPGGPSGSFAAFLQTSPAPDWRMWGSGLMWLLAAVGLWRGQVMADPVVPKRPAVSPTTGAGAGDGWRSLGVAVSTSPRLLGERDWAPLLLAVVVPCCWVALAAIKGEPAGVVEALAIARPFACLLLGLGLTGFAGASMGPEQLQRRKFVVVMVMATLAQFALGGHHVLQTTRAQERLAPFKIASFVGEEAHGGHVVALGAAGLAVAYKLDPYLTSKTVARVSVDPSAASKATAVAIAAGAPAIAVTGDKGVIEGSAFSQGSAASNDSNQGAGWLIHRQLTAANYELAEDGARYLSWFSVRVYLRADSNAGIQIKPQLAPGVSP